MLSALLFAPIRTVVTFFVVCTNENCSYMFSRSGVAVCINHSDCYTSGSVHHCWCAPITTIVTCVECVPGITMIEFAQIEPPNHDMHQSELLLHVLSVFQVSQ